MPTARAKAKANAPLCAANQPRPQSHPQTLPMLPLHSVAVAAAAVESNCAENFSPVRSVRVCLCVRFLCNACVCCPASLRVRRRNGPLASLAHMHIHTHTRTRNKTLKWENSISAPASGGGNGGGALRRTSPWRPWWRQRKNLHTHTHTPMYICPGCCRAHAHTQSCRHALTREACILHKFG